jgi:type VI secretion system secreted protein VgrG
MAATPRLLSVTTLLGPDAFLLTAFSGREEISRGFRYELEMLSDRDPTAVRELVGQSIAWRVDQPGSAPRWFHGVVGRLTTGAVGIRDLRPYRVVVVPEFWYRGQRIGSRFHEEQPLPAIVKAVLDRVGLTDYTQNFTGNHRPRPLCVQYRENDLAFVCRLLEEDGIFFFFTHEEERHTLVLTDDLANCPSLAEREILYSPGAFAHGQIGGWEREYDVLAADEHGPPADVIKGSSRCATFNAGSKFTLTGHDPATENGDYLLIAVEHVARDTGWISQGGGREYGNTFLCRPVSSRFRPARLTPRPIAHGPRLGVVVAPEGGRGNEAVRVRLTGDDAAFWVRVAGDGSALPRLGQEVRVDFLEGDPARPLIAGGGRDGARPGATREAPAPATEESHETEQGERVVRLKTGNDVLTLEAGNQTTRLDLGRSTTDAVGGIELRAGPSRITVEPTGVVIEGLVVRVHGHAQAEVKGLMTQVGADGVLEVKGAATVVG